MKNARPTNGKTSAPKQGDSKSTAAFLGTDNPRHLRVIQAVTVRPVPREELDRVAGDQPATDGAPIYFATRWNMPRELVGLAAVESFADRVGAPK